MTPMPNNDQMIISSSGRLPVEPPKDLPIEAQDIFQLIVREIGDRDFGETDIELVAMMAYSAHIHRYARRQIEATGVLVKGQNGPIINPLIRLAREEAAVFSKLAGELGLSFASRIRLGGGESNDDEVTLIIAALRGSAEVDDKQVARSNNSRPRSVENRRAARSSTNAVAARSGKSRSGNDRK